MTEYGPYGLIAIFALYTIDRLKKVELRLDNAEAANRKLTRRFERLRSKSMHWRDEIRYIVASLLAGHALSVEYLTRVNMEPEVEEVLTEADAEL